jgi:1-acyl-sn-glycerol-3-phosphate acyltransferase
MSDLAPHAGPVPPKWGRLLGRFLAWLIRWKPMGDFPDVPKAVFLASPHTSLWDGPIMVIIAWAMGVRLSFITKKESFTFPFKRFVTFFGGIGVDRSKSNDTVAQIAEQFRQRDGMYLAVAPAGTRAKKPSWRSGFYHMAVQAGVPVICGYLDYRRREGGIRAIVHLSGDMKTDMDRIRAVYEGVEGKFPALHTPNMLPAELHQDEAVPAAR